MNYFLTNNQYVGPRFCLSNSLSRWCSDRTQIWLCGKEENNKKNKDLAIVWWLIGTDSLNMVNSSNFSLKYGDLGSFFPKAILWVSWMVFLLLSWCENLPLLKTLHQTLYFFSHNFQLKKRVLLLALWTRTNLRIV